MSSRDSGGGIVRDQVQASDSDSLLPGGDAGGGGGGGGGGGERRQLPIPKARSSSSRLGTSASRSMAVPTSRSGSSVGHENTLSGSFHGGSYGASPMPFGVSPMAARLLAEGYVKRVPRDDLMGTSVESSKMLSLESDPEGRYTPPLSGTATPNYDDRSNHSGARSVTSSGFPFGEAVTRLGVIDSRDPDNPGSMDSGSSRSVRVGKDGKLALEVDYPSRSGQGIVGCFHPSKPLYRAIVLFLQCMLTFGSFYCYDIPGALKSNFFRHFPTLTQLQYNLMYSLYSWPNTVQVFFGGYIIDKYVGVRWGCFICSMLGLIGQIMVAIGVQHKDLDLVLIGRFIFGMGGETLCVAQSAYVAKWFKGSELATAFGICLSFSRLGSAVNFDVSPAVVSMGGPYGGFVAAEWWGVGACILSLTCVLVLNGMDHRGDLVREREKEKERRNASSRGNSIANEEEEVEEVSLSDIWTFGPDVWIIFLICISFYASVFVFLQNGVQFIRQRYGVDEQQAAFLMSLPYTISAVLCPIFGYFVDRSGRALVWVFASTSLLFCLHFGFAFVPEFPPWLGCALMGVAYSVCAAALWPCIAIVVELHKLGTAYGLMTAFQNLGLAVFPIVISPLLPNDDQENTPREFMELYAPVMSVFAACGAAGALLTLLLWVVDYRSDGFLNASAQALLERELAEEMEQEEAELVRQTSINEGLADDFEPLLPSVHVHVSHQRGRYLSRLGIRPAMSIHGGPRPFYKPPPVLSTGWEYERSLAHYQRRRDTFGQV